MIKADIMHPVVNAEDYDFSIYPNPADTFISFQLPETGRAYTVFLFDHTGKMIRRYIFAGGTQTIQIADLENGVYLIKIISLSDIMATAIAIQH